MHPLFPYFHIQFDLLPYQTVSFILVFDLEIKTRLFDHLTNLVYGRIQLGCGALRIVIRLEQFKQHILRDRFSSMMTKVRKQSK